MNKAELFEFLQKIHVTPNKKLSQNFLIDPLIPEKILKIADVRPDDLILEIGPGPGALTQKLLEAKAHVVCVEKDPIFAKELLRFDGQLEIHQTSILDFSFKLDPNVSWKIVANLPYHITTPILELLCKHFHLFSSFTLMVQKEVAEKIIGKKETAFLTIFLQFYTNYIDSFEVDRTCFYPSPNVDSTVIRLDVKKTLPMDPAQFFPDVKLAFSQKRKMITSTLKKKHPDIAATLRSLNIPVQSRPHHLSLQDWIQLIKA